MTSRFRSVSRKGVFCLLPVWRPRFGAPRSLVTCALLTCGLPLVACNGSGGGGGIGGAFEPPIQPACFAVPEDEGDVSAGNDTFNGSTVKTLAFGQAGVGDVIGELVDFGGTAAPNQIPFEPDVDFWRFDATAGQIIMVELFGTRLNQGGADGRPDALRLGWDFPDVLAARANIPRLVLWESDGDGGVQPALTHTFFGLDVFDFLNWDPFGWRRIRNQPFENQLDTDPQTFWGAHDMDFPCFRIPETGTYYLSVEPDRPEEWGGQYAVCLRTVPLGITQVEQGDTATTDNDERTRAEVLAPAGGAIVRGVHHEDEDRDYYQVNITSPDPVILCATVKAYRNGMFGNSGDYFAPGLLLFDKEGTVVGAEEEPSFFHDPALCIRLDPSQFQNDSTPIGPDHPVPYFLRVGNQSSGVIQSFGAAEYYLAVELVQGIEETEPNGRLGHGIPVFTDADPLAYGETGCGHVGAGEVPDVDIWSFEGTAGDMVVVQVFDDANDQTAVAMVDMDIWGPGPHVNVTPLPVPLSVAPLPVDTGGALAATRTILQETDVYYLVVTRTVGGNPTNYCVSLDRVGPALYETERNNVEEVADPLDGDGRAAGRIADPVVDGLQPAQIDEVDLRQVIDRDVFQFTADQDEVVTISAYAAPAGQTDEGLASDGFAGLSGHGSALHPRLRILRVVDDELLEVARSSYTPGGYGVVTTESVTRGLATAAVTFVADPGGIYYVEVTDERQPLDFGGGRDARELDPFVDLKAAASLYYVIERS